MGTPLDRRLDDARRVLIYRLGSLGDTLVALPCFHLIARRLPKAERRMLTIHPVGAKAAPVESILGGTGLIHGTMRYPQGLRDPRVFLELAREIGRWRPDLIIYLAEPRRAWTVWRDVAFFKLCGVDAILGAPLDRDRREHRARADGTWEPEAERLARCLAPLGDAAVGRRESWDLHLGAREIEAADAALAGWDGARGFLALGIGTKLQPNDWGDARWRATLEALGQRHADLGLVAIGVAEESERSARLLAAWPGPTLNLCGALAPRESAALLRRARLFLGHDSGPMHLAATVATPTVAVFSARNKPGTWFPYGPGHRPIYHRTPCFGCGLVVCERLKKICITSIAAEEAVAAAEAALAEAP
ncbi:MAG TPA: glycosyltransferase family 9 protein [Alphaproteobacteria bacterium]|nr:glycosyltransferase family 9 protein [Alphaproteobacteria bacterium]